MDDANKQFSDYRFFAEYLRASGWLSDSVVAFDCVRSASAAFESFQRKAGIEAAKAAMSKACEKAR